MGTIRQVQSQPHLGIIEIEPGKVLNALKSVEHGVAVDTQNGGRFLWSTPAFEECTERPDQLGIVPFVIVNERSEGIVVKRSQVWKIASGPSPSSNDA